jgi:histone acetyltransferase 1
LYFLDKKLKGPHIENEPFPLPPIDVTQLPARLRISQFLIIPPHQGSGHGTHLYCTIQNSGVADSTVNELTVEDPNEAFDALRDTVDFHVLRSEFIEHKVSINSTPYDTDVRRNRPRLMPTSNIIPVKVLQEIRKKNKIEPTQFAHILEMFLLSQIPQKSRGGGINMASLLTQKWRLPNDDDKKYYWWRMLVKQRLYKRHRDMLIQVDLDERVEKLDQTLSNVEEGYDNLLKAFMAKEEAIKEAEKEDDATGSEGRVRSKRKLVVEDEDEDEENPIRGNGSMEARAAKRPKTGE